MVEQGFVTSLIKSHGSILSFFERPVSAVLAASTIAGFASPPGTVIADAAEELIHKLNTHWGIARRRSSCAAPPNMLLSYYDRHC